MNKGLRVCIVDSNAPAALQTAEPSRSLLSASFKIKSLAHDPCDTLCSIMDNGTASLLKDLDMTVPSLTWLPHIHFPNIRRLNISTDGAKSIAHILNALSGMPLLKTLNLSGDIASKAESMPADSPRIMLAHLREAKIRSSFKSCAYLFGRLDTPSLDYIDFDSDGYDRTYEDQDEDEEDAGEDGDDEDANVENRSSPSQLPQITLLPAPTHITFQDWDNDGFGQYMVLEFSNFDDDGELSTRMRARCSLPTSYRWSMVEVHEADPDFRIMCSGFPLAAIETMCIWSYHSALRLGPLLEHMPLLRTLRIRNCLLGSLLLALRAKPDPSTEGNAETHVGCPSRSIVLQFSGMNFNRWRGQAALDEVREKFASLSKGMILQFTVERIEYMHCRKLEAATAAFLRELTGAQSDNFETFKASREARRKEDSCCKSGFDKSDDERDGGHESGEEGMTHDEWLANCIGC